MFKLHSCIHVVKVILKVFVITKSTYRKLKRKKRLQKFTGPESSTHFSNFNPTKTFVPFEIKILSPGKLFHLISAPGSR